MTVDELVENGLTPGSDFAVADSHRGELEICTGIVVEQRKLGQPPRASLEWIAYLVGTN